MSKYLMGLLVCVCALTSPALAGGGGGAKKDANIKVTNNFAAGELTGQGAANDSIIIIVDAPQALIDKVNGGTAVPKDITAAGGVIVKRGSSATIPVKAGDHYIYGAITLPGGHAFPATKNAVSVAKGKTLSVGAKSATPVASW